MAFRTDFPSGLRVALATFALAGLGGCGAPPSADLSERIGELTATGAIVRLEVQGGPDDVVVAGGAGPLALDEAVDRAIKNDPEIQAALARVQRAWGEAKQARLLPNPVITVVFRFPENSGKPVIEAGLAADLVALLSKPRATSAADNRLRAAASEALVQVLDTLAKVQEQYAQVQTLDAQVEVLQERQKLIGRLLDLTKARVQAGESGKLDELALDGERVALEVEITQTRSERREQRLALARMLAEPSFAADWRLTPWSPGAAVNTDEFRWVRAALEHRPELQARQWELAALEDEVALSKLALLDGGDIGVEAERDDVWSVGPALSAPIPLFDWGQGRKAKVQAERIEARHRLTQVRRQVIEEVRRGVESLVAAQSALEQVRLQLIPLEDRRVEQAEAAYRSGVADITVVLLAEQDAQAARAKLIELQKKASFARFRLERAVGGPAWAPPIVEQP